MFAESYREEARKLRALPAGTPAPRLLWSEDGRLAGARPGVRRGSGAAPAVAPRRAAARASTRSQTPPTLLTPSPAGLELDPIADEFAGVAGVLGHAAVPSRAWRTPTRPAALAARFAEAVGWRDAGPHRRPRRQRPADHRRPGAASATGTGRLVGAAWLDSLLMLIGPRGDGLDVEPVIAERRCCATYRRTTSTWSWP